MLKQNLTDLEEREDFSMKYQKLFYLLCFTFMFLFCGCKYIYVEDTNETKTDMADLSANSVYKYNYLEKAKLPFSDGNTPENRLLVEKLIDDANRMMNDDVQDFDLRRVFSKQENGKAIAMYRLEAYSGMQKDYYIVLRTENNGMTWEVNPKYISNVWSITDSSLYKEDTIVIAQYLNICDSGQLLISCDSGKTFEFLSYTELLPLGISNPCDSYNIAATIVDLDEANNCVRLKWYHVKDEEKKEIYTGDYDLSGKFVKLISTDMDYLNVINTYQSYNSTEEYLLPDSASSYISEKHLRNLCQYADLFEINLSEFLRHCINEIYARKGYDFTNSDYYDEYLNTKKWYHPINGYIVTEDDLNIYEKSNINLLALYEQLSDKPSTITPTSDCNIILEENVPASQDDITTVCNYITNCESNNIDYNKICSNNPLSMDNFEYNIQNDHGIIIWGRWGDASGRSYSNIIVTEDGGQTWTSNPHLWALERGDWELSAEESWVILNMFNYKSCRGSLIVSNDYGKTFRHYKYEDICLLNDMSDIYGSVLEFDSQENTATMKWFVPKDSYDKSSSNEDIFLYSAKYNLNTWELMYIVDYNAENIKTYVSH